jgi:hypothetical protein
MKAGTLDESGMAPCPRDANIKNGSHRKEKESTHVKQHQDKV